MKALPIVDSHVHLWHPTKLRYSWLDGLPSLNRQFLPADYSAASRRAGVQKFIIIESGCESTQGLAEVDWVSSLAKAEPRLKGIVAHAPLEKGEAVRVELGELARRPLVKGVRRLLQGEHEPDFCLRPGFLAGARQLAHHGFTFDICVRHDQLRSVVKLVDNVPQTTFVLDHFGKPDVRGGHREPWGTDLKALAASPNVVCKVSGLATEADWYHWQLDDLKWYFERLLEVFGFDRVLFGSDWPVATLATSYERWVDGVHSMVSSAGSAAAIKLFQTNAERIYRV